MTAFTPQEQQEFLAGLGLEVNEPEPEVVAEEVAVVDVTPDDYERPEVAERLIGEVVDIAAGGANPRDPKVAKSVSELIQTRIEFTGKESKDEREAKCREFFEAHKAGRSDLAPDVKSAYNSLLWRAANEVAKHTRVTHQAKAKAAAKANATAGQTGLKEHIKQTNAENDEAMAQGIADRMVALLLERLPQETQAQVLKDLAQ